MLRTDRHGRWMCRRSTGAIMCCGAFRWRGLSAQVYGVLVVMPQKPRQPPPAHLCLMHTNSLSSTPHSCKPGGFCTHEHSCVCLLPITRRLERMSEDKAGFAGVIMSRRQEEFERLKRLRERCASGAALSRPPASTPTLVCAASVLLLFWPSNIPLCPPCPPVPSLRSRLAERRAQRKIAREIARREEFVRRCRAAVEDKVEELEEQRRSEEEARRKAEREEQRRRAEEAAAKQRVREEEIERKLREEKAAALSGRPATTSAPPAAAAAAGSSGGAPGKFVPRALRERQEGSAPAAAAASSGGWRERDAGPPGPPGPPREREGEDRWARRDGPPPPASATAGGPPPPRPAAPSGGGGGGSRFVPPAMRRQQGGSEQQERRDDAPPRPRAGGW